MVQVRIQRTGEGYNDEVGSEIRLLKVFYGCLELLDQFRRRDEFSPTSHVSEPAQDLEFS